MSINVVVGAVIALVLAIGGIFFINNKSQPTTEATATATDQPLTSSEEPTVQADIQTKVPVVPPPTPAEPVLKINGQEQMADITYPQDTITLSWKISEGQNCMLTGYLGDSSKGSEARPVSKSGEMVVKLMDASTGYGLYAERAVYGLNCENGSSSIVYLNLKNWPK